MSFEAAARDLAAVCFADLAEPAVVSRAGGQQIVTRCAVDLRRGELRFVNQAKIELTLPRADISEIGSGDSVTVTGAISGETTYRVEAVLGSDQDVWRLSARGPSP